MLPQSNRPSRRTILSAAATAAAASPLATATPLLKRLQDGEEAGPKKRLLMLGGTRFLGPIIVRSALEAGWEVTLFNRGRSNPELFKELELRKGDRNTSDYESLAEGAWDLVVDTSCYIPSHVTAAIAALGDRAGHYLVVSTLSVYDDQGKEAGPVTEQGKLSQIEPEKLPEFQQIRDVGKYGSRYYGALKALCEQAAEEAMPGKVTVVRPGLIVGPDDGTDRFTYWPVRVAEGGVVVAPGDPTALVQYIDVRDLGVWTFDVGARRVGKVMNAVGFDEAVTMEQMLASCVPDPTAEGAATFRWISDEFLIEQGVQPWMGLPLWIPGGGKDYANAAARAEGLQFRSLKETAAATLAWHKENRDATHAWRAGITRDKEATVLAAWDGRQK